MTELDASWRLTHIRLAHASSPSIYGHWPLKDLYISLCTAYSGEEVATNVFGPSARNWLNSYPSLPLHFNINFAKANPRTSGAMQLYQRLRREREREKDVERCILSGDRVVQVEMFRPMRNAELKLTCTKPSRGARKGDPGA